MMDDNTTKVSRDNKRRDMKTLIFADDMLIWGSYKQETKEMLNQYNIIIKEYKLKINMDKVATMRISYNLNASVRIKVDMFKNMQNLFILFGKSNSKELMER
jgi:hypothetical protein